MTLARRIVATAVPIPLLMLFVAPLVAAPPVTPAAQLAEVGSQPSNVGREPVHSVDSTSLDAVVDVRGAPSKGTTDAPVTMIEFSDFQCPHCRRHARETMPQVERDYIATGKLRYVFRDLPISMRPRSRRAAEAAHCAGDQGRYWQMHDRLFASANATSDDHLQVHAEVLGLDTDVFLACLNDGKRADVVLRSAEEAEELGISGTPTFLFGISDGDSVRDIRALRGAKHYAVLKEQIEAMLAAPAAK